MYKNRVKSKYDDDDDEISFLLTFFFVNKYNFDNKKKRGELIGSVDLHRYEIKTSVKSCVRFRVSRSYILEFWKVKKNEHSRSYVSLFLAKQKTKRTRLGPKNYA